MVTIALWGEVAPLGIGWQMTVTIWSVVELKVKAILSKAAIHLFITLILFQTDIAQSW